MKVEAVRDHLNNKHKLIKKGTIYDTNEGHGRYLISVGVVREYVEAPKVEKAEFKTKPEAYGNNPESLGWHELRGLAKEIGVFSPKMNKDELIAAINEARK